jgi:superfamily II DNA or RNA helicase
MINTITPDHISLYRSLFQARSDIYAKRREKDGKSWYSPAYEFNRDEFLAHKKNWWTIATFENKKAKPLTDYVISQHLQWKETIWVYPLLEDNSSHFIVADFDDANFKSDAVWLQTILTELWIPSYIEISRSGSWAHVRVFFEWAYPAYKSRAIMLDCIRKLYKISTFTKEVSFDRIFPNQDYHSKKWYGNLIALPLQWNSLEKWCSCFVDASFVPYIDQWEFLNSIIRISLDKLDRIYENLQSQTEWYCIPEISATAPVKPELIITWSNELYLPKNKLHPKLVSFIKDNLNFLNTEYISKKRIGKSVFNTEKYFNCITEIGENIVIPRWFLDSLTEFCDENTIPYSVDDKRKLWDLLHYDFSCKLYDYQQQALSQVIPYDQWVLVAPPWSGKTVMWLWLMAHFKQKTLIIVHRQQLFDQWIERIQSFLWIMKKDIGQIKAGKKTIWSHITIAMMQTISKMNPIEIAEYQHVFGLILVDECHHIPAKTFRETIRLFYPYYLFGLTATPKRKHNDESLIYVHIWPILVEVNKEVNSDLAHNIIIKQSKLQVPFDYRIDNYATVSKILIFDTARNQIIIESTLKEIQQKRRVLILSERKEHVDTLALYLKWSCEVITLTGDDSTRSRDLKLQQIKSNNFQVLLSTWQLLWEGRDIDNLDVLFLVYPFSFEGKLIQYLGRLQRSKSATTIYDIHDPHIDYFDKLFKKRMKYYKKLIGSGYQIIQEDSLFT